MSENGSYNFNLIEKKWQDFWENNKTFKALDCDNSKPKYYVLDMFPYPSGHGLHVGHPEGYTASDIVARFKRANGFNVLHPMGWDAFGLPAEQYAIQTGTSPAITTKKNIDNIRKQIKSLGFSYDWDREISTTDPGYFKWTQWIFLKMFNSFFDPIDNKAKPIEQLSIPNGLDEKQRQKFIDDNRLAYEAEVAVNWCPALGTVLANEEVVGGLSERGGHPVIRKPMRQWMLRITKYAERLVNDIESVDWPLSIKKLQIDWVGKSIGAEVDFKVAGFDDLVRVFTTRPDTLFGATYMVMAPEHPLVDKISSSDKKSEIEKYRLEAARKSDLDRTDLAKEKTGVFIGAYAVNPVNGDKIPIWISDYVLISYGTGAIMAVPAHDDRDFAFATKFNLPIIQVVQRTDNEDCGYGRGTGSGSGDEDGSGYGGGFAPGAGDMWGRGRSDVACFSDDGIAINSGKFSGLKTQAFKEQITDWLEQNNLGKKAINYKLRDWLFSRQRYWGEPFPILHTEDGRVISISEGHLPLTLPQVENYKPTASGQPPLANASEWINVTLPDGTKAKRETNTMPQWAGSCWYYLRYIDPQNDSKPWDTQKEKYWMGSEGVDLYIGGAEHAVLHLLYSRFWHKFLYDMGYVTTKEPFKKLINQGMILGQDNQKMSKSRGNVVNPDQVIADFGADSLRLYEMFMGPLEATKPWNTSGVEGVHRFLQKVWRLIIDPETGMLSNSVQTAQPDSATLRLLHQTIQKVTVDIGIFAFNTAISQMMIFSNHLAKQDVKPKDVIEKFVLVLAPFAPHLAEELWNRLGHSDTLAYQPWPQFDPQLAKEEEVELAVQVLGKIKDKIVVPVDASEDFITQKALASEKVFAALQGKQPKKIIVIKSRLVNIIV